MAKNIIDSISSKSWARQAKLSSAYDSDTKQTFVYRSIFSYGDIPSDDGDVTYTVSGTDRIDILAYRFYSDHKLWWVIAKRNNLDFPVTELYTGRVIIIPSPKMIKGMF